MSRYLILNGLDLIEPDDGTYTMYYNSELSHTQETDNFNKVFNEHIREVVDAQEDEEYIEQLLTQKIERLPGPVLVNRWLDHWLSLDAQVIDTTKVDPDMVSDIKEAFNHGDIEGLHLLLKMAAPKEVNVNDLPLGVVDYGGWFDPST